MTSTIAAPAARTAARWNRPLVGLTAALALLTLLTLAGILFDDRTIAGSAAWLKPFKFSVSFALYAGTLAWMLTLLPKVGRTAVTAVLVIVATSVAEVGAVVAQSARGVPSHYNTDTALDSALWTTMAVASVLLFAGQVLLGVAVLRQRIADRAASTGVRLGLALSAVGMLAAVPMVLPMAVPGRDGETQAHTVGAPDGGAGMALTGWSTTGGDLRVGHFVGLHALQALPLLAFLLGRYAGRLAERTRVRLLVVAGAAYGGLTVLLTAQALRGQPLPAPDVWTLAALGVLVAGTGGAAVRALVLDRRSGTKPPLATVAALPVRQDFDRAA